VAAHELCGVVVAHALAFRREGSGWGSPLCDERDRRFYENERRDGMYDAAHLRYAVSRLSR
jgi:hypothetical protein